MKQVLIALDQLGNTLIWWPGDGFGKADETISARSYRLHTSSRFWTVVMKTLDTVAALFGDYDHCASSYWSEKRRNHLPETYRTGET